MISQKTIALTDKLPILGVGGIVATLAVGGQDSVPMLRDILTVVGAASVLASVSLMGIVSKRLPLLSYVLGSVTDLLAFNFGKAKNQEMR